MVEELLRDEYGFSRVADNELRESPGRDVLAEFTERIDKQNLSNHERRIALDKARRDARLFAAMSTFAKSLRESGRGGACVLVTSSGRLRGIGAKYGESADRSLSLAAALQLLTIVPGVSLGLSALQAVLFDGLVPRTSELDMLVLRAIRDANYDMPWARRTSLTRKVRKNLLEVARESGDVQLKPENVVAAARAEPETRKILARTIADSLGEVAADSPTERELASAQKRIRELEAQLARRK